MPTFLLTWNPRKWPWDDLEEDIRTLRESGELVSTWSCGNSRRPKAGDRFFMLRQGVEPRGIIGAGWLASDSYTAPHWNRDSPGRTTQHVDVIFAELYHPVVDRILVRDRLVREEPLSLVNWSTQSSGIQIRDDAAWELEELWREFTRGG
jgi:5-methylcytosine-specific restriction enzyme A